MQQTKLKLNYRYYFSEDTTEDADYLIVREDRFTYYVVDSISIEHCDRDKDERGLVPLFEIDKVNNGNGYNQDEVLQNVASFLISKGIEL